MLDSDLAQIYGYTTKAFNQQVKNNKERFPSDFMIELTKEETRMCSRSKNLTMNEQTGRGKNIKYRPKAFTEQGIYMLMTVLKGDLAVQQSLTLIRIFKQMRDFLSSNAIIFDRLDRLDANFGKRERLFRMRGTLFRNKGNGVYLQMVRS